MRYSIEIMLCFDGVSGAILEPPGTEIRDRLMDLRLRVHDEGTIFGDRLAKGFDAALRIGILPDMSMIARRLGSVQSLLVASPTYLAAHGTPENPQALAKHECLIYSGGSRDASREVWQFRSGRKWLAVRPAGRFRADNGEVLRAAGLGIAALPDFLVDETVAQGDLIRLLEAYPMQEAGIHLLRPAGGAAPARLRALTDHLAAWFGTVQDTTTEGASD